jgi:hypothetical protein
MACKGSTVHGCRRLPGLAFAKACRPAARHTRENALQCAGVYFIIASCGKDGYPASWHPPAPAGDGKRFLATG